MTNNNFSGKPGDRISASIIVPNRTIELPGVNIGINLPDEKSAFYSGVILGLTLARFEATILADTRPTVSVNNRKDGIYFSGVLYEIDGDYPMLLRKELALCGVEIK